MRKVLNNTLRRKKHKERKRSATKGGVNSFILHEMKRKKKKHKEKKRREIGDRNSLVLHERSDSQTPPEN